MRQIVQIKREKMGGDMAWLMFALGAGIAIFKDDLLAFIHGGKRSNEGAGGNGGGGGGGVMKGVLCPNCASQMGGGPSIYRDVCSRCQQSCAIVFDRPEIVDAIMDNVFSPQTQSQSQPQLPLTTMPQTAVVTPPPSASAPIPTSQPQQPRVPTDQEVLAYVEDVADHPEPVNLGAVEGTRSSSWMPDADDFRRERAAIQAARGYRPRNGIQLNIPGMGPPPSTAPPSAPVTISAATGESMGGSVSGQPMRGGGAMPSQAIKPAEESFNRPRDFLTQYDGPQMM